MPQTACSECRGGWGGGGCISCLGNVCLTVTVETVWGLKHFNKQLSCVNNFIENIKIVIVVCSLYPSLRNTSAACSNHFPLQQTTFLCVYYDQTALYLSCPAFDSLLPWLNHSPVQQRSISCEQIKSTIPAMPDFQRSLVHQATATLFCRTSQILTGMLSLGAILHLKPMVFGKISIMFFLRVALMFIM